MTERSFNLVAPLSQQDTAMRITDTAASEQVRSGAISLLGNREGDVDSATNPPRTPIMPLSRTSPTATRTTTTSTTTTEPEQSADRIRYGDHHADLLFTDLVQAYYDCRQHKRNTSSALAFEEQLEANICALYDELIAGTYTPGRSICFIVTKPKPREVWAADFRDRIVHHLLYNRYAAGIHSTFIADSCACIPGRGTLYAAKRLESKVRSITENWSKPAYYLKMDLANFFVSIDKRVLRRQLAERISDPWWFRLADLILTHDPRGNFELRGNPDEIALVPLHKQLGNQPPHLGLPIGNLSSQFFANIFLDALDQHCKHTLKAKHYIRYVDDFLILHESAQWLNHALNDISKWLPATLGVKLNPKKTILQPVDRGIDFVGQVIKPWRRTTRRRTRDEALTKAKSAPANELFETANSYFGLLRQASHGHQDRADLANILLSRGHTVAGDLTKAFRRVK